MIRRWILYLTVVVGCVIFYLAYQQWMSWLFLILVVSLPLVTQLVSLPAMLGTSLRLKLPQTVPMGTRLRLALTCNGKLPCPPVKCDIQVKRPLTGEVWRMRAGDLLPADHCGALVCRPVGARIMDYLGLFSIRLRNVARKTVVVYPQSVPIEDLPEPERVVSLRWRPKPGGGLTEQYELRHYRAGDALNQIHWKLSAKTGKLIIREPQEPVRQKVVVALTLRGDAQALDVLLGQLLWLSRTLLEKGFPHQIRALTGEGTQALEVMDENTLEAAMVQLLSASQARAGAVWEPLPGARVYRIGGGQP